MKIAGGRRKNYFSENVACSNENDWSMDVRKQLPLSTTVDPLMT